MAMERCDCSGVSVTEVTCSQLCTAVMVSVGSYLRWICHKSRSTLRATVALLARLQSLDLFELELEGIVARLSPLFTCREELLEDGGC